MINSLNPRSHLSQLIMMSLLGEAPPLTQQSCMRGRKSLKQKRKRLQEKLARRRQHGGKRSNYATAPTQGA